MMVFFEMSTTLITDFFTLLSKKKTLFSTRDPQITNVAFSLEQGKTVFFLFHLSKVHVLGVLGTQYEKNPSVGSLSHFKLK